MNRGSHRRRDTPGADWSAKSNATPPVTGHSRREFLLQASAAVLTLTGAARAAAAPATPLNSLLELNATEAVAAMRRGDVTVESYAAVVLERCTAYSALNAFITLQPDKVLAAARACDLQRRAGAKTGPLFGLPIPIKDSVNTIDYLATGGTPAL